MKKLLLLIPLFISCHAEKPSCNCTAKWTKDGSSYFYTENTEMDCKTNQPLQVPQPNVFFCGCK